MFILGLVLGVNWARWEEGYTYFWRSGHGGIKWLKEALMKDKSERLALIVITEQNQYQICSISDAYVYTELRGKE